MKIITNSNKIIIKKSCEPFIRAQEKGTFILFEGIDGAGKTTHANLIAKKIKGEYYASPSDKYKQKKKKIIDADPQSRFNFYLEAIGYDKIQIEKLLKKAHVIGDRYYLSTQIFNEVYLAENQTQPLDLSEHFNEVLIPDLIILVTARKEMIKKRLKQKGEINKPYYDINYLMEVDKRYKEKIPQVGTKYIIVDTSDASENEISQELLNSFIL